MIITKRLLLRIVFLAEIVCFFGFYIFGAQGLVALHKRKKEIYASQQEKQRLQGLVKEIEFSLHEWVQGSFLKEKIAREELHMARPDELVYIFE